MDVCSPEEIIIQPSSAWRPVDWKELIRSRELLYFLTLRDVKVRYKQTILGVLWAVLQPLFTMIIFSVIFGRFAKMPSQGQPYPLFVFAGLLPWTFFATGVTQASQSLVSQQQLLTKIYFPRLLVPTAAVAAYLIDLGISFALYGCLLLFHGVAPSRGVVFLPLLVALTIMATMGVGYAMAALTVLYRDFRYLVAFMIQALMYLSPIIYPLGIIPSQYHALMALNPMCGIIESYRAAVLGTSWEPGVLAISTISTIVLFCTGLFLFRSTERHFADLA